MGNNALSAPALPLRVNKQVSLVTQLVVYVIYEFNGAVQPIYREPVIIFVSYESETSYRRYFRAQFEIAANNLFALSLMETHQDNKQDI